VAEKAGKAAPAMAIAGALVATPHAQHAAAAATKSKATAAAAATTVAARKAVTEKTTLDSVTAREAVAGTSHYTVRSGDTLSGIAHRFYGHASDWQWLYHENDTTVSDPNLIYPGQTLRVPAGPPANFTLSNYTPRHAKPIVPAVHSTDDGDNVSTVVGRSASQGSGSSTATTASSGSGSTSLSGTLGCSGLEQLWIDAGGSPSAAFMAAEIAMAESGGNQYALSPTDDYGYWQINASNGALATFSAYGNARAAITLSNDGTNWSPWTTYTSGAYSGRC
jgi:LysM repeat protein